MCTMLRPALFIYYKWNLFEMLCLYLTVSLIKLLLLVINEIATKYCLCFMQHYLNYSCVASGDLHFKMLPWPNVYSYSVIFANRRHCRLRREILYLFICTECFHCWSVISASKERVKGTLSRSLCSSVGCGDRRGGGVL